MKQFLYTVAFLASAFFIGGVVAASAQDTSAAGIGVGISGSQSQAGAIAANVFNTPSATSARVSGTTRVIAAPSVFAPGLAAAGIETCLGSVSAGAAFPGGGFSFGSTRTDTGCDARLDARTLWAFGLKNEAVSRLCQKAEIAAAMPGRCGVQTAGGAAPAAPAVQPASANGAIYVIEGRTGRERLCLTYDAAAKRCRKWG